MVDIWVNGRKSDAGPRRGVPASPGYSGFEIRLLVEDPEVGAPELVHIHGAQLRPGNVERRAGVGRTGEVGDDELRTRLVGRDGVLRVGQHERGREVGVRAVDA